MLRRLVNENSYVLLAVALVGATVARRGAPIQRLVRGIASAVALVSLYRLARAPTVEVSEGYLEKALRSGRPVLLQFLSHR